MTSSTCETACSCATGKDTSFDSNRAFWIEVLVRQFTNWKPLSVKLLIAFWICQPRVVDAEQSDGPHWKLNIPWYKTATVKDRVIVKSSLSAMLTADWENKKSGVDKAQNNFETAWKLCSSDPRIPYACGLVLWQHGKPGDAIRRFEQAQTIEGQFFPAAFQAAAWCQFEQDHVSAGLLTVRKLAERLRLPEMSAFDPEVESALYKWIGQIYGFASRMDEAGKYRDSLTAISDACHIDQEPAIGQRFEQGRQSVEPIFTQLAALSQRSTSEILAELQPQLEKASRDLDTVALDLEDSIAELKQVKGSAKEAEIDKKRKNKRLAQVATRYQELQEFIPQLTNAERVTRAEMDNDTKTVQKRVVDEDATRRARAERNAKGNETVYMTVNENVKKSGFERITDRMNWESVVTSLQACKVEYVTVENAMATLREEAQLARKHALEVPKGNAARSRELSNQIAPQTHRRRTLERRVKQLTAWIEQPEQFRSHVRTLPPYVPWYAQDEREQVQQSFASTNDPK